MTDARGPLTRVELESFVMGLDIVRELADGGEELVKIAEPGEYFGEMGVLFHIPRSATVRARTGTRIEETAALCDHIDATIREQIPAGEIVNIVGSAALHGTLSVTFADGAHGLTSITSFH